MMESDYTPTNMGVMSKAMRAMGLSRKKSDANTSSTEMVENGDE